MPLDKNTKKVLVIAAGWKEFEFEVMRDRAIIDKFRELSGHKRNNPIVYGGKI